MQVVLAQPRGFCAGVKRSIEIAEQALARHSAPVCVFHEIVHKQWVVRDWHARGAVTPVMQVPGVQENAMLQLPAKFAS